MDAATVTAAASALCLILGFFLKVVKNDQAAREKLAKSMDAKLEKERSRLEQKLEECTDEHAACQLEIGGLRESVRLLSSQTQPSVRKLVHEQLDVTKQEADSKRLSRANSHLTEDSD